jgi:hypothetical protein
VVGGSAFEFVVLSSEQVSCPLKTQDLVLQLLHFGQVLICLHEPLSPLLFNRIKERLLGLLYVFKFAFKLTQLSFEYIFILALLQLQHLDSLL